MIEKCIIQNAGILRLSQGKNLLNPATISRLYQSINEFNENNSICAIVIAGTPPYFSIGADLECGIEELKQFSFLPLQHNCKPLIAAVDGFALGGGFELALACDMIYASPRSIFGFPEVKRGVRPEWGGCRMLLEAVGKHKAMEIVLRARYLTVKEAQRLGIVNAVVEAGALEQWAVKVANEMSLPAIPSAKRLILEGLKGK